LFVSRLLWRTLRSPSPVYWQRDPTGRYDSGALLVAFVLSGLALISGIILSVLIVSRAADMVAREYENDRFDLLAVTPPGGLGLSWARVRSFLHGELTLKTLDRLRYWALAVVLVIALFTTATLLVPALQRDDAAALTEAGNWLLFYVFLMPMMYFDYIYAAVSGSLISILVPTLYSPDARVIAIIAAVVLHISGYLVAALTGALMLPAIFSAIGFQGWVADLCRALGALAMFVLVHETLALLLYRAAQERLNGDDLALTPQASDLHASV
jgi:hypothetical protein